MCENDRVRARRDVRVTRRDDDARGDAAARDVDDDGDDALLITNIASVTMMLMTLIRAARDAPSRDLPARTIPMMNNVLYFRSSE